MRKLLSTLLDTLGSCCFTLSDYLSPVEMSDEAQERVSKAIQVEIACVQMLLQQQGHQMRLH